jgi:hypothetical protein
MNEDRAFPWIQVFEILKLGWKTGSDGFKYGDVERKPVLHSHIFQEDESSFLRFLIGSQDLLEDVEFV